MYNILYLNDISYFGVAFSSPWWHFISWRCFFYLDDIFMLMLCFLPKWHFLSWFCTFYFDSIFHLEFAFSTLMYSIFYLHDISYFDVAFFYALMTFSTFVKEVFYEVRCLNQLKTWSSHFAEVMGSNPVESPEFFRFKRQSVSYTHLTLPTKLEV